MMANGEVAFHVPGTSIRIVDTHRWRPVLVHALVVAPALLASLFGASPIAIFGIGGLAVLIGYPVVAAMEARRAYLLVSPASFIFAWSIVGLGVSPLWKAVEVASGVQRFWFSAAEIEASDLASGYALFLFGLVMFHAGMTTTRPQHLPGEDAPEARFPSRAFAFLWTFGIAASISYEMGVDSAWSVATGLIAPASRAALIALLLHAVQRRQSGLPFLTFVGLATILDVVLGFASGSKATVMTAFEPIVWALLFSRRLRWLLVPILPVFATFYLLVVYPVVMDARLLDERPGERFLGRITRVVDGEVPTRAPDYSNRFADFLDRQFEPTPVGYLVARVRDDGFSGGETLEYVGYALVPRLVWPEKPTVTRGLWFDTLVRGDQIQSALGQTATGELYWNFGIAGISIGMFVIGAMTGLLWRLAGDHPERSPIRMLLYYSVTSGTMSMAEAGTTVVSNVIRLVVFGSLIWVAGHGESRRGRRQLPSPEG
jgi:hypothetical protein